MIQEFTSRLDRLRAAMLREKLDGLVLQNRNSSLYLSGFPCSNSLVLITKKHAFFLTDFRYIVKAQAEISHLEVRQVAQQMIADAAGLVAGLKVRRLGFEETESHANFLALKAALPGAVDLKPAAKTVGELRRIKSPAEIRQIAANQRLNEKFFLSAVAAVQAGDSEISIRNHILKDMLEEGCEEAFSSIIAAGPNSALPHAVPSKAKVRRNAFLLFDMGVKKNYYHSDMTRTLAVGERLPAKAAEIYDVVRQAQQAALDALGPGIHCKDVDAVARDIITAAGYGDYFGHGLGHGVGLEIHEGPTLNPRSSDVLKPGMVVTVEPGIYVPGLGGVRIEDLVVITESGYRNLTSLKKDLQFITL